MTAGYTPIKGVDYFDGINGTNGIDGNNGADGMMNQTPNMTAGYTPIFGVDYFNGEDGYTPVFGVDYFNGEKGDKGDKGDAGTTDYNNLTNKPDLSSFTTLQNVYPVGSVYISTSSTNPATTFGFVTWAAISTGRVLIGIDSGDTKFDAVRETGGSETSTEVIQHTHPISITDPTHAHVEGVNSASTGSTVGFGYDASTSTRVNSGYSTSNSSTYITASSSNPSGSVSSFSLMNPYYVVYIWERTA